jgi:adenylate cyclase
MEQTVSFGDYRFDLAAGRLWSGAQELRLTPKASAVLKVLVENAGKPVSKKDLFASVWKETAVTDDALTSCIQELRKALADDAKQPRFIETRHRLGYLFAARLSPTMPAAAATTSPSSTTDYPAIAVLPFADMSPARDQDYLCEGLAEELINALTQVDGLRVVSRTASFQYRKATGEIREIGRQLGAGNLLEGSVQKSGDRLRITVQLVEVESGYHRWSQRFDRKLEDVFKIQDEIAETVVASLRGSVLNQQEKRVLVRPHTGAEAYEYYLRGRQYLPRMTESELKKSGEMFERAIELDGRYSPAFAGLAMVHATLYEWFGAKDEDLSAAERASQQALALTPDLPEAHVARGFTFTQSQRNSEAAQEFEEAIRLSPNLFDAYYYFARTSFASGEVERSAKLFRTAAETRLEDFQSPILLSQSLRMLGRAQDSTRALREGIRRVEQILMLNPYDARALALGAHALFHDGQLARAMEWTQRALELNPEDPSAVVNGACTFAKLGRKEEALELLERLKSGKRGWIEHDPDYEILRDDPRFQRLLERLK